ncbi:ferredoxin [Amycolatopsis acidicola]|uniref:Ferredoxin n=1 Tax=Amycolatopsis acidicola TaxID=2596893 RepID=A0A5N0USV4_9PSEU|nr:ferredoxin [Amycolatopsis acidicola]KAA9151070.1 ferredoxin [Amycolatopsis acidicola]
MRVTVDDDRCRGHGVCCAICPEVFALSDDGYAEVLTPDVPAEHENSVREAVESCPEHAITLS